MHRIAFDGMWCDLFPRYFSHQQMTIEHCLQSFSHPSGFNTHWNTWLSTYSLFSHTSSHTSTFIPWNDRQTGVKQHKNEHFTKYGVGHHSLTWKNPEYLLRVVHRICRCCTDSFYSIFPIKRVNSINSYLFWRRTIIFCWKSHSCCYI